MNIKIDFFNENIIDAISAGIYQVSVMNNVKRMKNKNIIAAVIAVCLCACAMPVRSRQSVNNSWKARSMY